MERLSAYREKAERLIRVVRFHPPPRTQFQPGIVREEIMRVIDARGIVAGDRIFFGDEIVTVVGTEKAENFRREELITLVTEDDKGSQFIDFVPPGRIFAAE